MSALDIPIPLTFFANYAAASKREEAYTPRALAERIRAVTAANKSRLPWLKLARFGEVPTKENSLRHDANVIAISGIEADYDGEKIPFDAAVERLEKQGIASLMYTSPSYTDDTPRWRVLCPLQQEMPPDRRRAMMGRINGLFGGAFSRESWTLSQAYYYGSVRNNPSHRVELIDGATIDQHDDLDEVWIGPGNTADASDQSGSGDERTIAELIRRILAGEEFHTCLCPLAARLIGRNVPPDTVADVLRGIMLAYPEPARDDRWKHRFAEISRLVGSAFRKYREPAEKRRENARAIAALTGRMIRERRSKSEIREAVADEATKLGVDQAKAESISDWIAEQELNRRRQAYATR